MERARGQITKAVGKALQLFPLGAGKTTGRDVFFSSSFFEDVCV